LHTGYTTVHDARFLLFEQICQVESVTIIIECDTDRSKGFAFVDIGSEDAEQAMAQSNGTKVGGRSPMVNAAHPREERGGHPDKLDMWKEVAPGVICRRGKDS
jgi:hypothetical protein